MFYGDWSNDFDTVQTVSSIAPLQPYLRNHTYTSQETFCIFRFSKKFIPYDL